MSKVNVIQSKFKDCDGNEMQISSTIGNVLINARCNGHMGMVETGLLFKVDELKEILKEIDRHQEILKGEGV